MVENNTHLICVQEICMFTHFMYNDISLKIFVDVITKKKWDL